MVDPQIVNGKLTYKIDKANSDLSGDDRPSGKGYEFNSNFDENAAASRLIVEIKDGRLILHNESGTPIATLNT